MCLLTPGAEEGGINSEGSARHPESTMSEVCSELKRWSLTGRHKGTGTCCHFIIPSHIQNDFPSSPPPLLRAELFWALYRVNPDTVPVDQKIVLWFKSPRSYTCPQNASASSLPLGKTWALGKPFLMEKQMDSQEGQQRKLSVSLSPCDIVLPFTPTVWSPAPFLGCPLVRPLQPHLAEPHWTAFYFPVEVTMRRDIQKHFKEMGWFPDQQGVYDVIKIIDLEKKPKMGQIERGGLEQKEPEGILVLSTYQRKPYFMSENRCIT